MTDIAFTCSACGQPLECTIELQGASVPCPKCNSSIVVPAVDNKTNLVIPTRPHRITAIAIIGMLLAIVKIVLWLGVFSMGISSLGVTWSFIFSTQKLGLSILPTGIWLLVISYGLFRARKWAWIASYSFAAWSLIASVTGGIFSLFILHASFGENNPVGIVSTALLLVLSALIYPIMLIVITGSETTKRYIGITDSVSIKSFASRSILWCHFVAYILIVILNLVTYRAIESYKIIFSAMLEGQALPTLSLYWIGRSACYVWTSLLGIAVLAGLFTVASTESFDRRLRHVPFIALVIAVFLAIVFMLATVLPLISIAGNLE